MRKQEAIDVVERIARWQATKLETTESIEAMDMAIAALREKADKERRYVVVGLPNIDKPFIVKDNQMEEGRSNWVATDIPTREAAQSIADIYEGVKP